MAKGKDSGAPKTSPKAPTVLPAGSLDSPVDFQLEDEALYAELFLKDCQLEERRGVDIAIQSTRLDACNFAGSDLHKLRLSNVVASGCDLSNVSALNGKWSQVHIARGRLIGLKLNESNLADVVFEESQLKLSQFYGSKLKLVRFVQCSLSEVDLRSCQMEDVSFVRCDLKGAELYGCKLRNVDFRTSDISETKFNIEEFKGAIIDRSQLMQVAELLARTFGINVLED